MIQEFLKNGRHWDLRLFELQRSDQLDYAFVLLLLDRGMAFWEELQLRQIQRPDHIELFIIKPLCLLTYNSQL